jgi:hypothetical protein
VVQRFAVADRVGIEMICKIPIEIDVIFCGSALVGHAKRVKRMYEYER